MTLGSNGVAAIAGSFLALVVRGVLAPVNWHLVFLVSVPIAVVDTVWAYPKLNDTEPRQVAKPDRTGYLTFAVGPVAVMVAIAYGLRPYGGHSMGGPARGCSARWSAGSRRSACPAVRHRGVAGGGGDGPVRPAPQPAAVDVPVGVTVDRAEPVPLLGSGS